jgi:hypothetical protein
MPNPVNAVWNPDTSKLGEVGDDPAKFITPMPDVGIVR